MMQETELELYNRIRKYEQDIDSLISSNTISSVSPELLREGMDIISILEQDRFGEYIDDPQYHISEEDMRNINRYSDIHLDKDDVYVIRFKLGDNEVDIDNEKLTIDALFKLKECYEGMEGKIYDSSNRPMRARIFSCSVEFSPSKLTLDGEPYCVLWANAYIFAKDHSEDQIISLIDHTSMVSIEYIPSKSTCSICGRDYNNTLCNHVRGNYYDDALCCIRLDEPSEVKGWTSHVINVD